MKTMRSKSKKWLMVSISLGLLFSTYITHSEGSAGKLDVIALDKIMSEWTNEISPGCVCGFFHDGQQLVKAYGMANMESGEKLHNDSVFYVASVSKQFTAAAIALLNIKGDINLDDSVRRYIPELNIIADPITIKDLLHHTSGLRDYAELYAIKGKYIESSDLTNPEVIKFLSLQKSLNFTVGNRFAYNNSNYILLAEIVKRVSDVPFESFVKQEIFDPLKMTNSRFESDSNQIVIDRVSSYAISPDGEMFRYPKSLNVVGDGNMLTTASDLLKWGKNFITHDFGGEKFINLLLAPGKSKGGDEIPYGFGLEVGSDDGLQTIAHGGSFMGFRAQVLSYPDKKLSVAILCNSREMNPETIAKSAVHEFGFNDIGFNDKSILSENQRNDESIPSDSKDYLGVYKVRDGDYLTIKSEKDNLYIPISKRISINFSATDKDSFYSQAFDMQLNFNRLDEGVSSVMLYSGANQFEAKKIDGKKDFERNEVGAYLGKYYSDELKASYLVEFFEGKIILDINADSNATVHEKLVLVEKDLFLINYNILLKFSRNDKGLVNGIHVSTKRAKNVFFSKIK